MKLKTEVAISISKKQYQINISDHILDNIYGHIGLTEVERKIEALPIFKRLHNISQLGLVNWIFPCALHTRYVHSIGVMHVAGLMAESINRNTKSKFFDDNDIQLIRLAGLLHDIGHYPMSHNIEQAYKNVDEQHKLNEEKVADGLKQYINCPEFLNPLYDKSEKQKEDGGIPEEEIEYRREREKFLEGYAGSEGMHHERIGAFLIANNKAIRDIVIENFILLEDESGLALNPKFAPVTAGTGETLTVEDVERIAKEVMTMIGEMVRGSYSHQNQNYHKYPWAEKYSAMIQIIHSELDADNLDYLIRDATFSGTSYGTMDMGVLLNSLTVAKLIQGDASSSKPVGSDGRGNYRYIIGVKKKGLGPVEQFLLNKFLAYTQMILSKHVSILEAMLLRLESDCILPNPNEIYSCEGIKNAVQGEKTASIYLNFSDYYIRQRIIEFNNSIAALKELARDIVSCLASYRAFKLCDNNNECLCTGFSDEEIKSEMEKNEVYKEFKQLCKKIEGFSGRQVWNDPKGKELFSFRFEHFSFTKQQPLKNFLEKYKLSGEIPSKKFDFHYFRLGNGIPIIESGKEYVYDASAEDDKCKESLPLLCVDCPQSSLHKLYSMEYVSLRKYEVSEYKVC